MQATVFETSAGWCGLAWSEAGARAFRLPESSEGRIVESVIGMAPGAALVREDEAPMPWRGLVAAVKAYFAGEGPVEFGCYPVDLGDVSGFARRVYAAMRAIPWGEVRTYGEVAAAAGNPRAARAVGRACALNPVPLLVPCHRVVAAGGIGGFGGRPSLKRRMLNIEGVTRYGEQGVCR